jgi:hypothetical protein
MSYESRYCAAKALLSISREGLKVEAFISYHNSLNHRCRCPPEIAQLRQHVDSEIAQLRQEMKDEISQLRRDMSTNFRWTIGLIIGIWGTTVIPLLMKMAGII